MDERFARVLATRTGPSISENTIKYLRKSITKLLIHALFLAGLSYAANANYLFDTIDISHGLSQSSVMSIAKDKYGFMWFGTEDGLDRYDGVEFKNFRFEPQNPTSINSSSIMSSLVTDSGELWFGTYKFGISKYNDETETFTHYPLDSSDSLLTNSGSTYALLEDQDGHIWFGTEESGLFRLSPESGKIDPLTSLTSNDQELTYYQVSSLFEDHQKRLWISTVYGLNVLDLTTFELKSYLHDEQDPQSLFDDNVNSVFETFDGFNYQIWVGTSWGGFDRFDPETETFIHHGFNSKINPDYPETGAITFAQKGKDEIWIGTDSEGILIVDAKGRLYDQTRRKSYNENSLPDDIIQALYDDGDIIWVGTSGGGVSKYLRNRKGFNNIGFDPLNPTGLHSDRILRVKPDKLGNFWIATWSEGLSYYNPRENSFTTFQHNPDDKSSLSDNSIQDILIDKNNNLWVISSSTSLDYLKSGSTKFQRFLPRPNDANWFQSEYLLTLTEDRDGNIWIGSWDGGFIQLDPASMSFKTFTEATDGEINLGNIAFLSVFQDSKGIFWIGAEDEGLLAYNSVDQSLKQYKTSHESSNSLPNDDVMYIYEDNEGYFWIGTYGGGLSKFDPIATTFENFGRTHGLSNESIYAIFEDGNGFLWMSTNNGISRFDKEKQSFKNFTTADGVLSKEFNPGACMDMDGNLYFGGIEGITYFDPLVIEDNQNIPPIQFIGLSIMNQEIQVNKKYKGRFILRESVTVRPSLTLLPGDLFFTIRYASLDYYHSPSNEYMYYLEGFDNLWHFNGNKRETTLTNLPSGDFILHVRGSNNDGIWNEAGISIPIIILPQFYETWWFILGIITIIALGIIMTHRLRTSYLVRRSNELIQHNIRLNTEIESRQQAHRYARERADYFHAVISQSPVPMAIHDLDGSISNHNAGWAKLWGWEDADKAIRDYSIGGDDLAGQLKLPVNFNAALKGQIIELPEVQFTAKDGEKRTAHILLYPLKDADGSTNHVMISLDDITVVIKHRDLIEKSLLDKELLIKEVHHRVKNNLQIIASLLGLQKAGLDDTQSLQTLEEFRNRVNSMALVHDALYRSQDMNNIDISSYINGLINDLKSAFIGADNPTAIEVDIHEISLPVDMAVPCGLLINELVTNALKYAFTDKTNQENLITVSLIKLTSNNLVLTIADNGVGFQQPVEWDSVKSLGLYLVKILGEQQLMGKVKLDNDQGSKFIITFPIDPDFDN